MNEKTASELAAYDSPSRGDAFRRELASVLNRFSMENASDTPDFLLADYLIDCLRALDTAVRARERYYGREKQPLTVGPSSPQSQGSAEKK